MNLLVLLVVRQDFDGLRRYVHVGTGNYHPETARLYSDIGLLPTEPLIAQDANELFNYLTTGFGPGRAYRKILPGPSRLKRAIVDWIKEGRVTPEPVRFEAKRASA